MEFPISIGRSIFVSTQHLIKNDKDEKHSKNSDPCAIGSWVLQ